MIYSVRGICVHTELSNCAIAVIECGGVGYKVQTSLASLQQIKKGSEATLYTYLSVREDAMELFGFVSQSELSTFKMLISINGVGPKVAIAILSALTSEQIALSVASNDYKTLTRAQGVGNKLAQRIVLELKDKIKGMSVDVSEGSSMGSVIADTGNISKAVAALSVLGFSSADVTPILSKLDPTTPVEMLVKQTLKMLK